MSAPAVDCAATGSVASFRLAASSAASSRCGLCCGSFWLAAPPPASPSLLPVVAALARGQPGLGRAAAAAGRAGVGGQAAGRLPGRPLAASAAGPLAARCGLCPCTAAMAG